MGIGIPDKKLFKIYTACQNGIFEKNICGENGNLICTMGIPITCMQLWCGKFPNIKTELHPFRHLFTGYRLKYVCKW